MTGAAFVLRPFDAGERAPDIRVTGRLSRQGRTLAVAFVLAGKLSALDLPPVSARPERRHELWRETCLEVFVRENHSAGYWEINLSPAGHWNIYRFDGYRQGMREEAGITAPVVRVDEKTPDSWGLSTELYIDGMASRQPMEAAVSAVIKSLTGHISYCALCHAGPTPDFHHPDGFLLAL